MPAILIWLSEAIGAGATWLGEIFGASSGAFSTWASRLYAWANKNVVLMFLVQLVSNGSVKQIVRAAIVVAVMAAYGVFLLVFWSYVTGSGLRDIFATNPFSGVPALAGALYLVSHAFPLKFMFATAFAYVQWRFTVIAAAITFSRVMRSMAGA